MNALFFKNCDYLPFQTENFLDFPLLPAFLRGEKLAKSMADFGELNNSIEERKFDEERDVDYLSDK